jgi:hypothetical protein
MNEYRISRFLGYFSLGLGIAELVAPRRFTSFLGTRDNTALVRAYGAREIASGIGILAQRKPAESVWSRVGGDVIDLATLGLALRGGNRKRQNVAIAIAAVAGVTLLDLLAGAKLSKDLDGVAGRYPGSARLANGPGGALPQLLAEG